jgi:hypothetical protein
LTAPFFLSKLWILSCVKMFSWLFSPVEDKERFCSRCKRKEKCACAMTMIDQPKRELFWRDSRWDDVKRLFPILCQYNQPDLLYTLPLTVEITWPISIMGWVCVCVISNISPSILTRTAICRLAVLFYLMNRIEGPIHVTRNTKGNRHGKM